MKINIFHIVISVVNFVGGLSLEKRRNRSIATDKVSEYIVSINSFFSSAQEGVVSSNDNDVKIARTQTIQILRRLEKYKDLQRDIINFLRDLNILNLILETADLQGINLSQANLQQANLKGANLEGAKLQQADLRRANLQQANLSEANLQQANLSEANLQQANLQQANLSEANLQQANLSEANLQQAYLWFASLQQAYLGGVNLQQANLWDANLQQAYLGGANLQQAFLWGAKSLTRKQIKLACNWERAIYKIKWNRKKGTWVTLEPDNTNHIEDLKKDFSSDPEESVDCSYWSR